MMSRWLSRVIVTPSASRELRPRHLNGASVPQHSIRPPHKQHGTERPLGDLYGLDRGRTIQQPRAQGERQWHRTTLLPITNKLDLSKLLSACLAQLLQWHHLPPYHFGLHDPRRRPYWYWSRRCLNLRREVRRRDSLRLEAHWRRYLEHGQ
jgi:hypothetical protein